jgi:hypothetical protein
MVCFFVERAMAEVRPAALRRPTRAPRAPLSHEELRRQLALFEDRPEDTMTWADAVAFLRSAARSIEAASRRVRG